jgi:hypothetical protein
VYYIHFKSFQCQIGLSRAFYICKYVLFHFTREKTRSKVKQEGTVTVVDFYLDFEVQGGQTGVCRGFPISNGGVVFCVSFASQTSA